MDKDIIEKNIQNANIEEAYVLAIFYNKVCVGYYENGKINFEENIDFNLCTSLRIFNKEKELRMEKINNEIYSKIIQDSDYKYSLKDEYMYLSSKVKLPKNPENKRLIVRNFIEIDSNNQLTITESRLVGFSKEEREVG